MRQLYEKGQTVKEFDSLPFNYNLNSTDVEVDIWEFWEFCYDYFLRLDESNNIYRPKDKYSEYDFAVSKSEDDFISFIDVKTIKPKKDFDFEYIKNNWTIKLQERQVKSYLKYSIVLLFEKLNKIIIIDSRYPGRLIQELKLERVDFWGWKKSLSYALSYNSLLKYEKNSKLQSI